MRKNLFVSAVLLFMAVSFWSCNNGGVPVYIQIDSVSLNSNTVTQGSAAHKISDVWIAVNGEEIGTFEYPVKVPVLKSGTLNVQISAGIRGNGINNTRVRYPFYMLDEFTINDAQPTQSYIHNPVFRYSNNAKFPFLADFEGSNGFSNVSAVTEDALEGNSCGKILLNAADTSVLALSVPFLLSNAGLSEVYVEMNYKCTGFFECGMLAQTSTGQVRDLYKITFNPRESWNKTYLNFSSEASSIVADNYRLYFRVAKNPEDPTPISVWLDNIKVVHR